MTIPVPEFIAFLCIAFAIAALRFWIHRQPDVAAAREQVRTICLWVVSLIALMLSGGGLVFPALRPASPVGFFVAFGAIYLLAAQQRAARRTQHPANTNVT
jgi:hypothetical protein